MPLSDDKGKSQIDKFREAARELETDDSEERFAEAVKRIGSAKQSREDKLPKAKPSDQD